MLLSSLAENGFMGMGIGAAMTGLRPIIEGMNMGFLLLAFNQISNNCGMLHYTSGGQYKTPVVIRGPGGVGRQLGAEHSQRLESYFQSIPGVQLVAVSTVANAKALLKSVSPWTVAQSLRRCLARSQMGIRGGRQRSLVGWR
jgi:pyruvate dehydrogenase E1 component beta subunit